MTQSYMWHTFSFTAGGFGQLAQNTQKGMCYSLGIHVLI